MSHNQNKGNIQAQKQALLARLLKERGISVPQQQASIAPRKPTDELVLSFAQQRLWLIDQMSSGSNVYNIHGAIALNMPIRADVLQYVFDQVVQRHETLRTTFQVQHDTPVQVIAPTASIPIILIDLQALTNAMQQEISWQLAMDEAQRPFNLAQGPLLRAMLMKFGPTEFLLSITMHHIISDGWSIGVLIREINTFYQAYYAEQTQPLAELPIQYADYAVWQRKWLENDVLQAQLGYWRKKLAGANTNLALPVDYARPNVQTFRGSRYALECSESFSQSLKDVSKQADATLFMLLLAAFNVLLVRYTQQEDILVGSPIANRTRRELESLIGFFVNTLVLRTNLQNNPSFREVLQQVRQTTLEAYDHQDVPFEKLLQELNIERHLSQAPLFQVMFSYQDDRQSLRELAGNLVKPLEAEYGVAKFDLTLYIVETRKNLLCIFEYSTDLFKPATIERMATHFRLILEAIVHDIDQHVYEIPLLSSSEYTRILHTWNNTRSRYPVDQLIQTKVEQNAAQTPHAAALIVGDDILDYATLNAQANQVAQYLQRYNLQPEMPIGVYMDRSKELLISVLGILKAGAAYVPLDPTYPAERLAYIVENAGISIILSKSRILQDMPLTGAHCIALDSVWSSITNVDPSRLATGTAANIAYIMYTSGSTGKPKGVAVSHQSVVNFLCSMQQTIDLSAHDRFLSVTTLSFDISVLELFLPLYAGACVVIADRETRSDGNRLLNYIQQAQITAMQATPVTWRMLLEAGWSESTPLLVLCGGEALPLQLAQALVERSHRAWNLYGPTETTIWSTAAQLEPNPDYVSIGRPIANTSIYLLDRALNPVPIGVPGELYIGGDGLARGYFGRPALTAERFLPHPYSTTPGARLYRTSDIARYGPDGSIEYLGRADYQVKVRGFRIELAEIEGLLEEQPPVKRAVAMVRNDSAGYKHIVAYIIAHAEAPINPEELQHALKQQLPPYMLPSAYMVVESFPLTLNNKIDRQALPVPQFDRSTIKLPTTLIETRIAEIWQTVLGIKQIGIEDNFFLLGGYSLLATQVVIRIRELFQVDLSLRQFFQAPTIADLATIIQQATSIPLAVPTVPLVPVNHQQPLPLSFAQEQLWFLDQMINNSSAYNIPTAIRMQGAIDYVSLANGVDQLVQRHAILRTRFTLIDDQPKQCIMEQGTVRVHSIDLQGLSIEQREAQITELAQTEAHQPFQLEQGPLLRVRLIKVAPDDHVLLITIHHIIADGWSMGILLRELTLLSMPAQHQQPLPELPVQYADYATWQRTWLQGDTLKQQLDFWRQQLAGAPALLNVPTDYPRPRIQQFAGAQHSFTLQPGLTTALRTLAQHEQVTVYMLLLSAFQCLLYRYSGQTDILVGSPIAHRTRPELEPLIGLFTNTLVMRTTITGNPTFRDLLHQVRTMTLRVYDHQALPFEKLVDELQPTRDLSYHPLIQVMFVLQNTPTASQSAEAGSFEPLPVERKTAKYDLSCIMVEHPDQIHGSIEYNTSLFEAATITRIVRYFQTLLQGIVEQPEQRILDLPFIPDNEWQILEEWGSA